MVEIKISKMFTNSQMS